MSNQLYMQNNFSHGELDPRLFSGTNLDYYYKSLKKARNVYVRPQGGIKKRHGTKYMATVASNLGDPVLVEFIFDKDTKFILSFQDSVITAYQIDDIGDIISIYNIVTIYTTDQVQDLQFAQNGNLMIITHPEVAPQELTWNNDTTSWNALVDLPIKNSPAYDFRKDYYGYKFHITGNVTVGSVGKKLISDNPVFQDNHIGGVFISIGKGLQEPIGLARILSLVSPAPSLSCNIDIIYEFGASLATTAGTIGSSCFLGENALSIVRGWPVSCSFYEDRLAFGGTPQLPQTIFMSRIGSFNDFDQGDGSDDDAIISTLSSSSFNEIKYLVSDKTLQVFCSESAFSSVQTFDEPLTPSASFRKQVAYGISNTKPLLIDNNTFYVREGGKAVMDYSFNPDSNSYSSQNVSIFSSHLINNPISGAVLKGDESEDADYMFLINEDGTLLSYQILSAQNVSAWTISVTGNDHSSLENISPNHSKFKSMTNIGNKIYAIIERYINGNTVQYLERLSFDYFTDSSSDYQSLHPTNVILGLNHLEGEKVRVVGDKQVLRVNNDINNGKVTSGQITLLESDTAVSFKVGINFNLLAETVPANIVGQGKLYIPKKIVRMFVDYYESVAIKVNGEFIPELSFGDNVLNQPPVYKTGVFTTRGLDWKPRVTIQITQDDPVPFLVIGLGFEVTI